MKVAELKKVLEGLPDDMEVSLYDDEYAVYDMVREAVPVYQSLVPWDGSPATLPQQSICIQ